MPLKLKTILFIVLGNLFLVGIILTISFFLFGDHPSQERFFILAGSIVTVLSVVLGFLFLNFVFLKPFYGLIRGINKIRTEKSFSTRLEVKGESEFSQLAVEINEMLETLQKSEINYIKANDELKQQTTQLETKSSEFERINKHMVGRELRMAELKEKIKDLEEQLNARQ